MTCDDWNSFIQVNIYGKTIEGLQQQGVVLETLLNNVGCSKLWIVEGSVCTSSTPESSTYSEKRTIEPVVSLSTTLATNKLPRFSTPAVGHSKYNSAKNFTLNLAEKLSEILSDDDKTDKCLENSYQSETSREDVIQDLLEEMVQTVADVDQAPILLSTTLANIGVPRFSTPIKPQNGLDRKFTMNMTERISEIDSNYLGYEVLDDSNKILTANCEEVEMSLCENIPGVNNARTFSNTPYDDFLNIYSTPKNPKSNSSVPYQEGKRRSSRRLSTLSSLKESVKIEPAVSKSTKRSRLAPIQILSQTVRPNIEHTFPVSTSAIQSDGFSYEHPINEYGDNESFSSAKSHCDEPSFCNAVDLKPVLKVLNSGRTVLTGSIISDQPPVIELSRDHNIEGVFQNNFVDVEDTMLIENYEEVGAEIVEVDDQDQYEVISEDDEKEKSPIPSKNRVSFAFPLVQSPNKQKEEMNKVHNIKCHFDNCNRKIHWKIRYGKLRLVDHALSHQEEKSIDCQKCEYSCQTTRQMRYHYKKIHANLKMEGFGILNIPLQNTKFSDVWNKCFGDQLKTIGPVRKAERTPRRKLKSIRL